jgi:hypothetical protein
VGKEGVGDEGLRRLTFSLPSSLGSVIDRLAITVHESGCGSVDGILVLAAGRTTSPLFGDRVPVGIVLDGRGLAS